MKRLIWFAALTLAISSCELQEATVAPPVKPAAVPEQAFWIGGHEGGVFILISKQQGADAYFGTVYFDTSGEVWYQGEFQYTGDAPFEVTSRSSYTGWDGDFLFLANGQRLIAVGADE